MVRSGGKPYRTDAQKHGGGKTRRQQLGNKLRENRRYLRENNLVELTCHDKPSKKSYANQPAVYGLYKDEDASYDEQWVLTALSVSNKKETLNNHRGGGYSSVEVKGRYAIAGYGDQGIDPRQGLEIGRFEKKSEAMSKVNADGSNRVEYGYVIRPEHDPKWLRGERFDKDEYRQFKQTAQRIFE